MFGLPRSKLDRISEQEFFILLRSVARTVKREAQKKLQRIVDSVIQAIRIPTPDARDLWIKGYRETFQPRSWKDKKK